MAMAKLANSIISIKGKFAGMVFRRGPHGQHVQAYPRLIHRKSPKQQAHRNDFSRLWHHWWKKICTQAQRDAWQTYAVIHPLTGKKGIIDHPSAFNWFLRINIIRAYNNLDPILDPPKD